MQTSRQPEQISKKLRRIIKPRHISEVSHHSELSESQIPKLVITPPPQCKAHYSWPTEHASCSHHTRGFVSNKEVSTLRLVLTHAKNLRSPLVHTLTCALCGCPRSQISIC